VGDTPLLLQVSAPAGGKAVLSFVGEIPPGSTRTYLLRDDTQGKVPVVVTATKEKNGLVLSSALLGVRMPAVVEKTYTTPVSAATLPAPMWRYHQTPLTGDADNE
jgi:hypothetical protein